MRTSPFRVALVVLTVLAGLTVTALPALAASTTQSPFPVRACNFDVCETLVFVPPPQLEVDAVATPPTARCGTFAMTVATPTGTQVFHSPRICSFRPTYTFLVRPFGILPPGSTIAMQFDSSPATPGRPVIRL